MANYNTLQPNKVPDEIDLLYPDLMSKDGLLYILKQRYIDQNQAEMESLGKEALIDLYNQYILPLPQRKYRSNRRGKEMSKKQIMLSNKRFSELKVDADQPLKKKYMLNEPQGYEKSQTSFGDRLKPPPSSSVSGTTVIKLGSSGKDCKLPERSNTDCKEKQVSYNQSHGNNTRKRHLNEADNHHEPMTHSSSSPSKKRISKISWP